MSEEGGFNNGHTITEQTLNTVNSSGRPLKKRTKAPTQTQKSLQLREQELKNQLLEAQLELAQAQLRRIQQSS